MGKRLYDDRKWRKARLVFLNHNPVCVFCARDGIVSGANVVDHIVPHKGDVKLFWDVDNWQALCEHCHNSTKQRIENGNERKTIGHDGWPREMS